MAAEKYPGDLLAKRAPMNNQRCTVHVRLCRNLYSEAGQSLGGVSSHHVLIGSQQIMGLLFLFVVRTH